MTAQGGYTRLVHAKTLDHVAVWTPDRHALADVLVGCCAMHEIERTDEFTLVGGDARRGKLTLFDAEGVRERGSLERVVLRVPDVDDTRDRLEAAGLDVSDDHGMPTVEAPSGLSLALVEADETRIADLDTVVLRVHDPGAAAGELEAMGLERAGDDLRVADKRVVLRGGGGPEPERPLLNHLAFLVDQADEVEDEARERGLEIDKVVDAENTRAVFVWGPDRIKLEYVEHKPGFSLV
jgi:catechol 2,3-dioxygenase-like lactoylglutathione lyase family enzyme